MNHIYSLTLLIAVLSAPVGVMAQEIDAREVVKKTDELLRGRTNQGTYEMTITTPAWQRTLKIKSWQDGQDKTFIRILAPAKDAGVGFLKLKNEMWTYLPSVERTIKIPPSMMMQPWMGSDFTNDDLVKESSIVEDYVHRHIGSEKLGEDESFKIESIPKPDAPVVWGKIVYWVRKSDFMPQKAEYYDENGKRVRRLTYSRISRMHDRTIPTLWEMVPLTEEKKGRKTIIRILDVEFNAPIDDVFNMKNLQRTK